jgi:hypothetical protein
MGVPAHLIILIKNIYVNNLAYVHVESELSDSFHVEQGVRQSYILSPLLFNIYGEWIMRKTTENWNGGLSIGGIKISNFRYADDMVLLASTESEMAIFLEKVEGSSADASLELNRAKCSIMMVDKAEILPVHFELIPDIERKENVIYLGARISSKGGSEEEIKRRLRMAG